MGLLTVAANWYVQQFTLLWQPESSHKLIMMEHTMQFSHTCTCTKLVWTVLKISYSIPSWIITWSKSAQMTLFPTCGEMTTIKTIRCFVTMMQDVMCWQSLNMKALTCHWKLMWNTLVLLPMWDYQRSNKSTGSCTKVLTNVVCQALF